METLLAEKVKDAVSWLKSLVSSSFLPVIAHAGHTAEWFLLTVSFACLNSLKCWLELIQNNLKLFIHDVYLILTVITSSSYVFPIKSQVQTHF